MRLNPLRAVSSFAMAGPGRRSRYELDGGLARRPSSSGPSAATLSRQGDWSLHNNKLMITCVILIRLVGRRDRAGDASRCQIFGSNSP